MGFQNTQQVYAQAIGSNTTGSVWIDTRNPTSEDINFKVGQLWQNTSSASLWFLNSFTSTLGNLQADWQVIDTASTDAILTINDIPPATNGNFTLSEGNGIKLNPITNGINIQNIEGVAKFVVDSQGNAGYTSIQAAVNAAGLVANISNPQTVWIWPATYIEDVTMSEWVSLASAGGNVIIQGTVDYASDDVEVMSFTGIRFAPLSDDCIQFSGIGQPEFIFNSCRFTPLAGDCINWNNVDSDIVVNPVMYFNNCTLNATSGHKVFNIIGAPIDSRIVATSTSWLSIDTASTVSDVIFDVNQCSYSDSFVATGSFFLVSNSSGTNLSTLSHFNIDSETILFLNSSSLLGTPTYLISGTGDVFYDIIGNNSGNSSLDPSLNVTSYQSITGGTSFDKGVTFLNTASQCLTNQVVLGTSTSVLNVVSGTGNASQVLTSNGPDDPPTWEDAAVDLTFSIIITTFTSNGTFTADSNLEYAIVECIGGGGGGGGSGGITGAGVSVGGAGSGGTYARRVLSKSQLSLSQSVTIGAGGLGGAGGNIGSQGSNGNDGGNTSLGSLLVAHGGNGGNGTLFNATFVSEAGAAGSSTSTGAALTVPGGAGGTGWGSIIGTNAIAISGAGGTSFYAGGSQTIQISTTTNTSATGPSGVVYGGGGSGGIAATTSTNQDGANGGDGAAGIVVVTQYILQ